ncbi:MAG: hypothetical protein Q4F28_03885 [Eubacteriales bacterium]|nr:hypothetical protein [Eubacteriales bacterium]
MSGNEKKRYRFRKIAAILAAAGMAAAQAGPAYALPSPTVSGIVTGAENGKDSAGKDVNIVTIPVSSAEQEGRLEEKELDAIDEMRDEHGKENVFGAEKGKELQVLDILYVAVDGDESQVQYPIDVTLKVTGVSSDSVVYVLLYEEERGEWTIIETITGDEIALASLPHAGLIAVVSDGNTAAALEQRYGRQQGVSPKTGQPLLISLTPIAGLICLAGMVCVGCREKTRRKENW